MNSKQARSLASVVTTVLALLLCFDNCGARNKMTVRVPGAPLSASIEGGGTTGGNPARTALKFGPFREPVDPRSGAPVPTPEFDTAAVQSLSICIDQIRFFPTNDGAEVDVPLKREILALPDGTSISDVSLPLGAYNRIVFELNDVCNTGRSFEITTASESIESTSPASMEFAGAFSSDPSGQSIILGISDFILALSKSKSDQDALDALSNHTGSVATRMLDGSGLRLPSK